MRRCEKMWEDMRRCEKVWEGVRRCEDEEKMGGWEDVKMRRCEDVKMWRREDVKMRRCFTGPHYWKNPALRRSREKWRTSRLIYVKRGKSLVKQLRFMAFTCVYGLWLRGFMLKPSSCCMIRLSFGTTTWAMSTASGTIPRKWFEFPCLWQFPM